MLHSLFINIWKDINNNPLKNYITISIPIFQATIICYLHYLNTLLTGLIAFTLAHSRRHSMQWAEWWSKMQITLPPCSKTFRKLSIILEVKFAVYWAWNDLGPTLPLFSVHTPLELILTAKLISTSGPLQCSHCLESSFFRDLPGLLPHLREAFPDPSNIDSSLLLFFNLLHWFSFLESSQNFYILCILLIYLLIACVH